MPVYSIQDLKQQLIDAVYPNTNREIDAGAVQDFLRNVLDSTYNQISQAAQVGLKEHDASGTTYNPGDTVLKYNAIWQANSQTSGAFSEGDWDLITGLRQRLVTADYTVSSKGDRYIYVDTAAAGGTVDVTLPPATGWADNRHITVVNLGGSQNVRILPDGSDSVDGGSFILLELDKSRAELSLKTAGSWVTTQFLTTDGLPEGLSNLYFTDARAISALTGEDISLLNNDAGYITQAALKVKVDNVQNSLYFDDWHPSEWLDTTLFSQTEPKTVTNDSIVGGGVGSMDLPEEFLVAGKKIELRARGTLTLGSGDNLDLQVSIGPASVSTSAVFGSLTPSQSNYEIEVDIIARSGQIYIMGFIRVLSDAGSERVAPIPGTLANLDFGTLNPVDVTAVLSDPTNDQLVSHIFNMSKKA